MGGNNGWEIGKNREDIEKLMYAENIASVGKKWKFFSVV